MRLTLAPLSRDDFATVAHIAVHPAQERFSGTPADAFALAIEGVAGLAALAADTDGIDGSESNAGAFADGGTAAAMRRAGIDPGGALAANDAWSAFAAIGALFEPGPTGTNVNDLRIILIK